MIQARHLISVASFASSACLMSHDLACEGGGVRDSDKLCICPEGTMQEGRVCRDMDVGADVDLGTGEDADVAEDSSAEDSELACSECDAALVEPDSGDDAGEVDAAVDAGTDTCVMVAWYADCDGDGYAVVGADTAMACEAPPPAGTCAGWTRTEPRAGATDCNDVDRNYRPGAGYGLAGDGDGDLNCDGMVQRDTVLHKFSLTPNGQGEVDICQSSSQCDCVYAVSGNPSPFFECSHHDRDWMRDFGRKSETCSAFVYQSTDVPRAIGLQYCR